VYRETRGRRIIRSRLVAQFAKRTASFAWNGRANIQGQRVTDGYYVAKLAVPVGRGSDLRQLALLRRGGRFKSLPPFVRTPCATLSSLGLNRPVFGGSNNRSLVVYYRLHRTSRVTITLNRGGRVVKRFRTPVQAQGPHRIRIPARGVRAGSYHVVVTAAATDGTRTRAQVTARRL
jgi:hypothetical protein